MASRHKSISVLQLGMLMFTTAGVMAHVIIIPLLLQSARRDAWISVLVAGALFILWALLLVTIIRRTSQSDIGLWIQQRATRLVWYPLLVVIVAQLFAMSAVTLRDACSLAKATYLADTPIFWIVLLLAVGCFFTSRSGLSTIAITNGILFPIICILGMFVALGNLPHKDYSYLRPLLEHGVWPTINGVVYAGAAFSEATLVLFLQPFVKTKIRWYAVVIIAVGLIALTMGPLLGAITEFGPYEAARLRYPAYEEWRLLTFKHFVEHVDFFSIYQWLAGAFIRISLAMFLIPEIIRVSTPTRRDLTLAVVFLCSFVAAVYPISDEAFIHFVSRIYLPVSLISMSGLFAILFALTWWFRTEGDVR